MNRRTFLFLSFVLGLRPGQAAAKMKPPGPLGIPWVKKLGACSKVSEENFSRVQVGMTEQEVAGILGSPSASDSINVLGISGTSWRWKNRDAVASVQFVNGMVATKLWEKPSPKN